MTSIDQLKDEAIERDADRGADMLDVSTIDLDILTPDELSKMPLQTVATLDQRIRHELEKLERFANPRRAALRLNGDIKDLKSLVRNLAREIQENGWKSSYKSELDQSRYSFLGHGLKIDESEEYRNDLKPIEEKIRQLKYLQELITHQNHLKVDTR